MLTKLCKSFLVVPRFFFLHPLPVTLYTIFIPGFYPIGAILLLIVLLEEECPKYMRNPLIRFLLKFLPVLLILSVSFLFFSYFKCF